MTQIKMGNSKSITTSDENQESSDLFDFTNGLLLSDAYIPEEILVNILTLVHWKDVLSCRLVCHSWKRLIDSVVCFEKVMKDCKNVKDCFSFPIDKIKSGMVPFYIYYAIGNNIFGKNFLKNAFGSGEVPHVCQRASENVWRNTGTLRLCSDVNCPRFKDWTVVRSSGDGWVVEVVPVGSEPLPGHLAGRSCFATSYNMCTKLQLINLADRGMTCKIMDDVRPHIEVSEWYARRFDCGIRYNIQVWLLDANQKVIDHFTEEIIENNGDNDWHQVSHTFKDYGPGVRYVLFQHEGTDTQFWAGHYGSKMAGGSVVARIPELVLQQTDESD